MDGEAYRWMEVVLGVGGCKNGRIGVWVGGEGRCEGYRWMERAIGG